MLPKGYVGDSAFVICWIRANKINVDNNYYYRRHRPTTSSVTYGAISEPIELSSYIPTIRSLGIKVGYLFKTYEISDENPSGFRKAMKANEVYVESRV